MLLHTLLKNSYSILIILYTNHKIIIIKDLYNVVYK